MSQGHYPVNQSDADEFKRLSVQDDLFNVMFRLLPPGIMPKQVLDVGCGTGGWLRCLDKQHIGQELVGLDKSALLLSYARRVARHNKIEYVQGDMLNLAKIFKNRQFDLIQIRCSSWFLGSQKHGILAACNNLLAHGGMLRIIDYKTQSSTNSAAFTRFTQLFDQAMLKRGTAYRGVDEFPELLESVGLQDITLSDYAIDLSAHAPHRKVCIDDLLSSMQTVGKLILSSGMATEAEFTALYEQCVSDSQRDDFTGSWQFLEIIGQKT